MRSAMTDVLERLRASTFETRDSKMDAPRVSAGCFVKVGIRGERFWCKVVSISDGRLHAILDGDLLNLAWPRGHKLVLQHEHVLASATVALSRPAFKRDKKGEAPPVAKQRG